MQLMLLLICLELKTNDRQNRQRLNFWRTLEMSLIICGINLYLNWSKTCVIVSTHVANQGALFSITDTIYAPVVTLAIEIMQNYYIN